MNRNHTFHSEVTDLRSSCFFPSKWTWHELEGRTKILVPDLLLEIDASLQKTWRSGWWYFWKLYFWSVPNCLCYLRFLLMSPCWMTLWPIFPFLPPLIPISTTKPPLTTHRDPPKKTHTSLTSFKMPWIKSSPRPGDSRLVSQPRRCRCIWCILNLIPRCRNCWTYPYVIVVACKQLWYLGRGGDRDRDMHSEA